MTENTFEAEVFSGAIETIDHTPAGALVAGVVVVLNDMIGITREAIEAARKGALMISGNFRMLKASTSGSAIAKGKVVYWDDTNNVVTETALGNIQIGNCIRAAADGDTHIIVNVQPPSA